MYFSSSHSPSSSSSSSYSTSPMEISSPSSSRSQSPTCAFPSWPRRSSLSSSSNSSSSSSFIISDEELFPSVFDDAEQDCTPPATPYTRSPASPSRMYEVEARVTMVDHAAFVRQLVAEDKAKKERRERRRKSSGMGRKKSRSTSGGRGEHMSPILEVVE